MTYLLQHLLTHTATRRPRRPAVAAGGRILTYRELDRLSNQAARALLARGVAPGDRVGILAPKSAASVVGIFGALKAGACYVPLDPKSPAARLSAIMADSGIGVVLADRGTAHQAAAMASAVPRLRDVMVMGPHWGPAAPEDPAGPRTAGTRPGGPAVVPWEEVLAEPDEPLAGERAIETDLAYILYTSGSTGTPKGVMISHRASLTFITWAAACVGLTEDDRVCSPAPLHFDLSVFDIFAACKAAARTAILPEGMTMFPSRLAEWMARERISVWYSVPSTLTMLAAYGDLAGRDLSALRAVVFAGEVFPARHLARLMAALPHPRYLNWYGPTETNVCTWYEVPAGGLAGPAPIGKACANTDVFAVTAEGRRVTRPGDEGELYVRGPGLMHGYWGQPGKTGQVLVRNPFQDAYDEPVYRTGDLVTVDADGNYVFLGRRDGMVKTRGYRVELGEVETALYEHPAVREAVVLPMPDDLLGSRLRAVIAADPPGLTRQDVLDHCRRRLPGYMVPDVVEFCEALPRTSTGKVDRARLAGAR
ncbi:MAG TPA: amino acid adenylation domain-containing protein [Trebonia sp.]|nr:amino acid adenylation domain-containing protein [Trebonia sp.]